MGEIAAPPATAVEWLERFRGADLHDLCDATILAVRDGGGFGWVELPDRDAMERYWRGVITVPGRSLAVARLDGMIVGSAQLVRPPPNNEAQAYAATLTTSFVAPWARGHGLARRLTVTVEELARRDGFDVLFLDVRETQLAAIQLYRQLGYIHWGTNPVYARVHGRTIGGHFFYKMLNEAGAEPAGETSP